MPVTYVTCAENDGTKKSYCTAAAGLRHVCPLSLKRKQIVCVDVMQTDNRFPKLQKTTPESPVGSVFSEP